MAQGKGYVQTTRRRFANLPRPGQGKTNSWYCSLVHVMFTFPTMIKGTAFTIVSLIIFKHKMTCSCSSYLLMYYRFKLSFDDIGNLAFLC